MANREPTGSFPYLNVSLQYDVSYERVLNITDFLDQQKKVGCNGWRAEPTPYKPAWMNATIEAWNREQERRHKM